MIQTVLRYPGAKWVLSKWICDNLPPHEIYLEPFFGSGFSSSAAGKLSVPVPASAADGETVPSAEVQKSRTPGANCRNGFRR